MEDVEILECSIEEPFGVEGAECCDNMWMKRNYPQSPFERYADDGVVHCQIGAI